MTIGGLRETSHLKETKAKREKAYLEETENARSKGRGGLQYPQRAKTLDCNHIKAKCYQKGKKSENKRGRDILVNPILGQRTPALVEAVMCPAKNIFTLLQIRVTDKKLSRNT